MGKYNEERKRNLVIALIGVIASTVSAVAATIRLIRDILKDKKQENNPPHQG